METISWLKPTQDLLATLTGSNFHIDFAAGITTPGGEEVVLLVEMKQMLRPADVPSLADKLESYSEMSDFAEGSRIVPLVAAKWLSPRTQQELKRAGLGWFDLAGNAHIEFPGVYLHVEGIDNPFKTKSHNIQWTSEHGQRVFRVLLDPKYCGHYWRQREIQEACVPQVSLGTVNKVVKNLVNEAYTVETTDGLLLRDPGGLLKQWAQHYSPFYQQARKCYTHLHGDALMESIREFCSGRENRFPTTETDFALAGLSAAKLFAPYVRDSTLYCYATPNAVEQLINQLDLQESPKGANVILWVTKQPDAFLKAELIDNVYATNALQTYLDLWVGGERSREAAEFLYSQKLRELLEEV